MNKIGLILLTLALLAGCSASNMAQMETHDGKTQTVLHSNNSMLASRLGVSHIITGDAGNLMKAQATLENKWKFQLDFQYKIKWFDASGFEVQPESEPWQQLVLAGRTEVNVQALAPNPSAVRFEIWVQE